MTYELAKKLKDAGFPGFIKGLTGKVEVWDIVSSKPSLSELIEACGDGFSSLSKVELGKIYLASSDINGSFNGPTPEEAVAKLWLKLNKHD